MTETPDKGDIFWDHGEGHLLKYDGMEGEHLFFEVVDASNPDWSWRRCPKYDWPEFGQSFELVLEVEH